MYIYVYYCIYLLNSVFGDITLVVEISYGESVYIKKLANTINKDIIYCLLVISILKNNWINVSNAY